MKKKNRVVETLLYCVAGLFALAGLALIITGIVGTYLGVAPSDNPIISSQATLIAGTGMGYRWWGIIFLLIGAVLAAIVLTSYSKFEGRDEARRARRQQRMAVASEAPIEAKVEEVKPAE